MKSRGPLGETLAAASVSLNGLRITRAAMTKQAASQESYLRTRFTCRLQPRKRRRVHALVGRRPRLPTPRICEQSYITQTVQESNYCRYMFRLMILSRAEAATDNTTFSFTW